MTALRFIILAAVIPVGGYFFISQNKSSPTVVKTIPGVTAQPTIDNSDLRANRFEFTK